MICPTTLRFGDLSGSMSYTPTATKSRRCGADWGSSTVHFIWQNIPNLNNNVYKECIVAIDSARQIRVIATKNSQFCSINVWLRGYVE